MLLLSRGVAEPVVLRVAIRSSLASKLDLVYERGREFPPPRLPTVRGRSRDPSALLAEVRPLTLSEPASGAERQLEVESRHSLYRVA